MKSKKYFFTYKFLYFLSIQQVWQQSSRTLFGPCRTTTSFGSIIFEVIQLGSRSLGLLMNRIEVIDQYSLRLHGWRLLPPFTLFYAFTCNWLLCFWQSSHFFRLQASCCRLVFNHIMLLLDSDSVIRTLSGIHSCLSFLQAAPLSDLVNLSCCSIWMFCWSTLL